MHLIRLLNVSTTFVAREIPMGRYRVVGLKALPRFGSGVPAVRGTVRPGMSGCWVPAEVGEDGCGDGAPADGTGVEDALPRGAGSAAESDADGQPAEPGRRSWFVRAMYWLAERLPYRRNPFESGGPRLAKTTMPQQGCLRLDGIKVVRNDLADSDFEVKPAAPKRLWPARRKASKAVACEFGRDAGPPPPAVQAGGGVP